MASDNRGSGSKLKSSTVVGSMKYLPNLYAKADIVLGSDLGLKSKKSATRLEAAHNKLLID